LERTGRRLVSVMLFAALLSGGILLRPNDEIFGNWLMVASVVPLLHALFAGLVARRGRLP